MNLHAVEIESVLFEDAVRALVAWMASSDEPDAAKLVQCTAILQENMPDIEKLASLAAVSVLLLSEKERQG